MNEMSKQTTMINLQKAESVYCLVSLCTSEPYIVCDAETYDDQIYIYFDKDTAQVEATRLMGEKIPVKMITVPKNIYLPFYSSLFSMGVNRLVVDHGTENEIGIQLNELIKRSEKQDDGEKPVVIENPELHLTALYYMQEVKRDAKAQQRDDVKELFEELLNHFQKGKYLIPAKGDSKEVPLLRQQNGNTFYPIFTDLMEFQKFCSTHKEEKWQSGIIEAQNLHKVIPDGVKGVTVNPMGVNLLLQMVKK